MEIWPAFMTKGTGSPPHRSGSWTVCPSTFLSAFVLFSKGICPWRWEPGMTVMGPFSSSTSSMASQIVTTLLGVRGQ